MLALTGPAGIRSVQVIRVGPSVGLQVTQNDSPWCPLERQAGMIGRQTGGPLEFLFREDDLTGRQFMAFGCRLGTGQRPGQLRAVPEKPGAHRLCELLSAGTEL